MIVHSYQFKAAIETAIGGYSINKGDELTVTDMNYGQLYLVSGSWQGINNFAIITPATVNELAGREVIPNEHGENHDRPPIFIRIQ